jgi:hypothetical protein
LRIVRAPEPRLFPLDNKKPDPTGRVPDRKPQNQRIEIIAVFDDGRTRQNKEFLP